VCVPVITVVLILEMCSCDISQHVTSGLRFILVKYLLVAKQNIIEQVPVSNNRNSMMEHFAKY